MSINVKFALAALLCALGGRAEAQSTSCASPNDPYASAALSGITALASGSDDAATIWRSVAKVPPTSASAIALVHADSVCNAAALAFAQLSGAGPVVRPVWVVAIGTTHYVVFDKQRRSAGRLIAAIFDASMHWVADVVS